MYHTTRITRKRAKSSKDRKEKEDIATIVRVIETQFDKYDGDALFNLLLVRCVVRKAFFLDNTSDVEKTRMTNQLARDVGLHVKKDPTTSDDHPGYWIYKTMNKLPTTSEETGIALGFLNPSSDDSGFGNFRIRRITLSILEKTKNSIVTSEIVLEDMEDIVEFAKQKVALFNEAMIERQLPYRFKYKIDVDDGTIQRMTELNNGNTEYIITHQKEYIDDLENIFNQSVHPFITLFKKIIHNKRLLVKYTPLFLMIYKQFNKWTILDNGQLERIYKKFIDMYN